MRFIKQSYLFRLKKKITPYTTIPQAGLRVTLSLLLPRYIMSSFMNNQCGSGFKSDKSNQHEYDQTANISFVIVSTSCVGMFFYIMGEL